MPKESASTSILDTFANMAKVAREKIFGASATERKELETKVVSDPGFPERFQQYNVDSREKLATAVDNGVNTQRKTWFSEYVYSRDYPILGTMGKILTMKPVEGVATVASKPILGETGSRIFGKISRAAAIAAALYFGTPYLFQAFGAAEEAATTPGIDWLRRFNQAGQKLGNEGILGSPGAATETYGYGGY